MAAGRHTATISPDLIQQLFQLNYENDERERAGAQAEERSERRRAPTARRQAPRTLREAAWRRH